MTSLPNDIESLKELIHHLLVEIEQLKAENAALRCRLDKNSGNSDKPPSSDGYKKKTTKPAIPKEKGKRNGGQKGHQGKTLERVEQPDHIEIHLPQQCDCCGRSFESSDHYEVIQSRQVFDLPEPKLEVTEHQIGRIKCCGQSCEGHYPKNVTASVQYGAGVKALTSLLSVNHKMPLEKISELFNDLFGYPLNSSTTLNTLQQAHDLAKPLEAHIKQQILSSDVVHFDETGIRTAGKLHWLHTASTVDYTHLFVHEKRGQQALNSEDSLLKDYTGTAVHDCWSPYFKYDKASHALCGAHLLRELNSLKENDSQWATNMHDFLLGLYKTLDSPSGAAEINKQYETILGQAEQEEEKPIRQPKQRGRIKQSVGRNLLNRLQKYQSSVLAFSLDDRVPFTNNQAERDLRNIKVKQKVSGGFRTVDGAVTHARLQAIISTFRKQGMKVYPQLRELFSSQSMPLAWVGR